MNSTTSSTMKVAMTNLGMYNEGALLFRWLDLPATIEEIVYTLKQIGIDKVRYEEWFISDYECDFLQIHEYDDINTRNTLAELTQDNDTIKAVIELEGWNYWKDNLDGIIEHVEEVILLPDVDDQEELGYWLADNGYITIPEELEYYFDYERYGRDWDINCSGGFTSYGYLLL